MASNLNYIVRKAVLEDKIKAQEFLIKYFFGQSPLHEAFQMDDHPAPDEFVTYSDNNRNFALLAIDSNSGDIIGVASVEEHPPSWRDPHKSENSKNYVAVSEFAKKEAKIEELVDATELYLLSVSPEGRNKGVGKRLARECVEVAKEFGFKTLYMNCVSEFSARVAKSLGWREHYRLPYADYGHLSRTGVIVNTPAPHKYLTFYVTELKI